jgi:hypothetical protein
MGSIGLSLAVMQNMIGIRENFANRALRAGISCLIKENILLKESCRNLIEGRQYNCRPNEIHLISLGGQVAVTRL